MAKLTKKQQLFVEEYLIDLNATQAAIRAGYSPETAKDIGCENLAKPNIKSAIDKALAARSKRTGVNQDRVVCELAKIAFVNITDLVDIEDGSLRTDVTKDDTAAISSIKVKRIPTEEGYIIEREIKMYDKSKALEQLGRHLGMFTDKLGVTSPEMKEIRINIVPATEADIGDDEE